MTRFGFYELHIPDSQMFLCQLALWAQTGTHICWYMHSITKSSREVLIWQFYFISRIQAYVG